MRCLAVLLMLLPHLGAEPGTPLPLREARAWRGVIEVEALAADGCETQTERVEFVAETAPRRTLGAPSRLKLQLRRATGHWKLAIDRTRAKRGRSFALKGSGAGELRMSLTGELDMASGRVVLRPRVQSRRLVAKTTLSGVGAQGFGTYRSVASRRACTGGDVEQGKLDADRRSAKGERSYDDVADGFARKVTVRWTLERIDPEVRGRVVDRAGRPIKGLRVVASTVRLAHNRPGTFVDRREATTDSDGRFAIPAVLSTWGIRVVARREGDVITAGWLGNDSAALRFDHVPDVAIKVERYRLSSMPQPALLQGRFRGDVERYLDYVTRRFSKARIAASRATSSN